MAVVVALVCATTTTTGAVAVLAAICHLRQAFHSFRCLFSSSGCAVPSARPLEVRHTTTVVIVAAASGGEAAVSSTHCQFSARQKARELILSSTHSTAAIVLIAADEEDPHSPSEDLLYQFSHLLQLQVDSAAKTTTTTTTTTTTNHDINKILSPALSPDSKWPKTKLPAVFGFAFRQNLFTSETVFFSFSALRNFTLSLSAVCSEPTQALAPLVWK